MALAKLGVVVLDCPDPGALARFYAEVLGGTVGREDDDWVELSVPEGQTLAFQRAAGHTPPQWPRADHNGQQLHLDFDAGSTWAEIDAAHEKVLALGARPLDLEDREKKDFQVYADPAGHPFCLCRIEHG
ncbi:VOC family protein [Streptomyces misionensis]|uniref:VOC family protein n=1 Tax=Streptomyces misionensis TaxID=67331 RepID=UPI0033D6964D